MEEERVTSKTGASRITVELIRGATLSGVSLVKIELYYCLLLIVLAEIALL